MKKLIATLSALSLLASVSAFAQETGTDAPVAEETPATTEERGMKDCAPLTDALKKKLCELHNERMKIKAAAKAVHESKVAKTARKAEKKAARAAMKGRKEEMKQEVRMMKEKLKDTMREGKAAVKETRENFRGEMKGVRQQKVRREHKAGEQSKTEESGQALLQTYGGSDASSSTRVNPGFNQKAIRPLLRSKGVRRFDSRARDSSHRSRVESRNSLDAHARLRKNVSLPRQSEPMEVKGAQ